MSKSLIFALAFMGCAAHADQDVDLRCTMQGSKVFSTGKKQTIAPETVSVEVSEVGQTLYVFLEGSNIEGTLVSRDGRRKDGTNVAKNDSTGYVWNLTTTTTSGSSKREQAVRIDRRTGDIFYIASYFSGGGVLETVAQGKCEAVAQQKKF